VVTTCRGKLDELKEQEGGNQKGQADGRATYQAHELSRNPPPHQAVDDETDGGKKRN